MQYPETRYARGKEGAVAYQVLGDGPLDLVFIPWWVSNVDAMWEEPSIANFLRRLSAFSRLLCFDKRGTGVSDPVPLGALPKDLVAGSGIRFADRGLHVLKGVPGEWRLFTAGQPRAT